MSVKLKIAFLYGWWNCPSKSFDFFNLFDAPQGLTGSEISCFSFARELARRGHEVTIYTVVRNTPNFSKWEGCTIRPVDEVYQDGHLHDVFYSWNDPDILRFVPPEKVRMVNQQINDFGYCKPDFDHFVDVYTSPSAAHLAHVSGWTKGSQKWELLPNGVDINAYQDQTIRGRCVYASSPDRGLHWLLQAWPAIKRQAPHAELRVFYDFDYWFNSLREQHNNDNPVVREHAVRAAYIKEAFRRLADQGVSHQSAVSRNRMVREFNEAEVLAYPCDPCLWTEGFSVSTMEACASWTVPVICGVDALPSIYGGSALIVDPPMRHHVRDFSDAVVRVLNSRTERDRVVASGRRLAAEHTWSKLTDRLEAILGKTVSQKLGVPLT